MSKQTKVIVPRPTAGSTLEKGFGPAASGSQATTIQQNPNGSYSSNSGAKSGGKVTRK